MGNLAIICSQGQTTHWIWKMERWKTSGQSDVIVKSLNYSTLLNLLLYSNFVLSLEFLWWSHNFPYCLNAFWQVLCSLKMKASLFIHSYFLSTHHYSKDPKSLVTTAWYISNSLKWAAKQNYYKPFNNSWKRHTKLNNLNSSLIWR